MPEGRGEVNAEDAPGAALERRTRSSNLQSHSSKFSDYVSCLSPEAGSAVNHRKLPNADLEPGFLPCSTGSMRPPDCQARIKAALRPANRRLPWHLVGICLPLAARPNATSLDAWNLLSADSQPTLSFPSLSLSLPPTHKGNQGGSRTLQVGPCASSGVRETNAAEEAIGRKSPEEGLFAP